VSNSSQFYASSSLVTKSEKFSDLAAVPLSKHNYVLTNGLIRERPALEARLALGGAHYQALLRVIRGALQSGSYRPLTAWRRPVSFLSLE
jgi:hypothetical protein